MGQEAPGKKEQKAGDMGTWDMGKGTQGTSKQNTENRGWDDYRAGTGRKDRKIGLGIGTWGRGSSDRVQKKGDKSKGKR
jgi:hypothetical protein